MPGELQLAIQITRSLLGPDGGCLPLHLGDLVRGGSLVRDPDDAVVHVGVGHAGSRGGLQGKTCAVCPVQTQTEPPHLHFPLNGARFSELSFLALAKA